MKQYLCRLLVERQNNWVAKLLKVCKMKPIPRDTDDDTECDDVVDTRTISTLSSSTSPRSRTSVMETKSHRTLPTSASNNVETVIGTKYGTGRLFQNPLVSSPGVIYHHHQQHQNTNEDHYETIEHQ